MITSASGAGVIRGSPLARRPVSGGSDPAPHTAAELAALMRLLSQRRPRVAAIVIGSSRDAVSRQTARAVEHAWIARGGQVRDVVDWPEDAASWLRPARRFTVDEPDAWVVTGRVPGWVQMGRRLAHSTEWDPARTLATSSLADDALVKIGGPETFEGLHGVCSDGGIWRIDRAKLIRRAPESSEAQSRS